MLVILGCSKSQLIEGNQENPVSNTKSEESSWTYYNDGSLELEIDSTFEYKIAFVDGSTYTAYFFSNDTLFIDWALDQEYYADSIRLDLEMVHRNLDTISDYAFSSGADLFYEQYGYISNDMLDFMYAHGLPENTRNEARQLYKEKNFINSIHISALIPIPSLGSARNQAQSLKQFGIAALNAYCDRTWFRGPRIYVFTLGGVYAIPDLGVLNFNKKCESIYPIL